MLAAYSDKQIFYTLTLNVLVALYILSYTFMKYIGISLQEMPIARDRGRDSRVKSSFQVFEMCHHYIWFCFIYVCLTEVHKIIM